MAEHAGEDGATIRVENVYEGDALLGDADSGHELVCTRDAVQFDGGERAVTIPRDAVTNVRVDVDESVSGFTRIGNLFGVASLLLVVALARMIFAPGGVSVAVGGAALLAAPLSAFGAVWMRSLEVGERQVLRLDYADGDRVVFVTDDAGGAFDAIESRLTPLD